VRNMRILPPFSRAPDPTHPFFPPKHSTGVDEAGRGPLAGPVVAAAVVLPRDFTLPPGLALDDSKKMDAADREAVFSILTDPASRVCWAAHAVPASEIDRINILQATMVAMDAAVAKLANAAEKRSVAPPPSSSLPCPVADPAAFDGDTTGGPGPPASAGPADYVLVDGPRLPPGIAQSGAARPVVKGDAKCAAIAAASVVAKVTRDRLMARLDAAWPAYGFASHKGYGTAAHVAALRAHGPCPQHRRTFAPVKDMV
jgi:ribonuclease HII